jgi:hypothetical protein
MDEWDWIHQIAEIHKSSRTEHSNSYHTLIHKCGEDDVAIKLIITIFYYTSVVKTKHINLAV